ncbi:MAG: hypothetical protein AB1586_09970 [Pseudomonadota bacterium]|jgi:hypothetical protein
MENSESVLNRIEGLQAWCYQHIGRQPSDIPRAIDLMKTKKLKNAWDPVNLSESAHDMAGRDEETDPQILQQREELWSQFRTTKYQDPVILGGIASQFDDVKKAAARLKPRSATHISDRTIKAELTYRLTNPVLGTIPVSILNGFAIKDENDNHGIILQDGLRFLPFLLTTTLGRALFLQTSNGVATNFDRGRIDKAIFRKVEKEIVDLFLLYSVISSGELRPSEIVYNEIYSNKDLTVLSLCIEAGFKFFVLAHEYAHCISNHFDQLEKKPNAGLLTRDPDEIKRVYHTYMEKYGHIERPDDEQTLAFCHHHAIEFDADRTAIRILIEHVKTFDPTFQGLGIHTIFGALLFLMHLEMLENVQRTVEFGDKWFGDPLFDADHLVYSLLHRPTHPSPRERQIEAIFELRRALPDLKTFERVMGAFDWMHRLFSDAWQQNRNSLAETVRKEGLTLGQRWVSTLPNAGLHIGAPT